MVAFNIRTKQTYWPIRTRGKKQFTSRSQGFKVGEIKLRESGANSFTIGCKTSLTFYSSFFNTTAPRPLVIRPSADLTGPISARYSPQWWVDTVDMISQWTGVTAEQLTSLGTHCALVSMFGTLTCITWCRERE